jgi:O-antigen/teichoic acid export membrane protein
VILPKTNTSQTKWTIVVRVANVILVAVSMVIVARVLRPDRFGEFSFIIALISIASIPPTAGLRQTLARETAYARARHDNDRISKLWIWALRWSFLTTLALATGIGAWAIWGIHDPNLSWNVLFGLGLLFFLPFPQIFGGALQGAGRVVQSQIPEFLIRPTVYIFVVLWLWLDSDGQSISVVAMLLAFTAAVACDAIFGAWFLSREHKSRPLERSRNHQALNQRTLTLSALSFGAIASAHLINGNLDVLMLGILDTNTGTGIYKAASIVSQLVAFGLGVVNVIILPRIATMYAKGDLENIQRLVVKSAQKITAFAFVTALLLVLGGRSIITIMFGEAFAEGYLALVILAFGQLGNAVFGPVALVLNMTGNERWTLIGLSASVAVNAALNLALIPPFGISGAALATASSLLLWNVLLTIVVNRRLGITCMAFRAAR